MEKLARRPGLWILVLGIIAVAVFAILRVRGPVVPTTAVVRKDLEQHLVASGRVRAVTRVALAAQTAGRIVAVPAEDGRRR